MQFWRGESKKIPSNLSVWVCESGFNPIFNMSVQNCGTVAVVETGDALLPDRKKQM